MIIKHRDILNALSPDFARDGESQAEYIERKHKQVLRFVSEYTKSAHAGGWVIGISGGIDSFLVGALLAECAKDEERELIAVLMPNGEQPDIGDAEACADVIRSIWPGTHVCTVNIKAAYEGMLGALESSGQFSDDPYSMGNLQPRLRMTGQYALARGLLVAGTDHASEAVTGFYTKYGDGGVDFNPIGQMIKDDIYDLSALLGAPKSVMDKAPAAGIGISADDESELKLSYRDICRYLKGYRVSEAAEERLTHLYDVSAHKRAVPPTTAWLYRTNRVVTHIHCGNGAVRKSIKHINEHPDEEVLYVNCGVREFADGVEKTVNTPLGRYNFFEGQEPANEQYGLLADNVHTNVVLSGDKKEAQAIAETLENVSVKFLTSCFSD